MLMKQQINDNMNVCIQDNNKTLSFPAKYDLGLNNFSWKHGKENKARFCKLSYLVVLC